MLANAAESLPKLPVHALSPIHSTSPLPPASGTTVTQSESIPRSASAPSLPQTLTEPPESGLRRNFSENVLPLSPQQRAPPVAVSKELFRRASKNTKKRMSEAKFVNVTEEKEDSRVDADQPTDAGNLERARALGRSVSGSLRGFARRSWMPSSPKIQVSMQTDTVKLEKKRSRSPKKSVAGSTIAIPAPVASRSSSRSSKHDEDEETYPEVLRAQRQSSPNLNPADPSRRLQIDDRNDNGTNISRTPSSVSLSSRQSPDRSTARAVAKGPLPKVASTDRLSVSSFESVRRKDPLWGAFRTLEGDLTSFQSKSSIYRTKIVRSALLPFLHRYAEHPSNVNLRADDLDRRVNVLNKWWHALLDVLSGKNNQVLSATDRPVLLEGVSGIMMRPEWRIPISSTISNSDAPSKSTIPSNKSSQSLYSTESDYLTDSVNHMIRDMFAQNLLLQMAFVVERLSMRTAPASLVAFCGKACAYAFFFCPGIADILVRLWRLPPNSLRRIFSEFGIERNSYLKQAIEDIASAFPEPVRHLCCSSPAALSRQLQQNIPYPSGAVHIQWNGPWVRRWSGRESDLFFAFTKFYHILAAEHLVGNMAKECRACLPGLVVVHAQILTILEDTLYRQAGQTKVNHFGSKTAASLEDPDAKIPIPLTVANATRSMAENRLLMLLRDILADTNPHHQSLRDVYALTFNNIMKAATRKISLYNNDASIVLCDFLDEYLPLVTRYCDTNTNASIFDWTFWVDVCRKMMQSHHTLAQVRLISFLYTTWIILTSDDVRKRELVFDWLLEPTTFATLFSHWCPMVRHYFHRLVCWRIARCGTAGDGFETDTLVVDALKRRLNTQWAHYQYLKAEAEMRDTPVPSSAPCSPAPNRRLLIIRTDTQSLPSAVLAALDNLITPSVTNQSSPYQSHSSALNSIPTADSPTQHKKRWGLFKNIIPFNSTPGNSRPGEVTPPLSSEDATFVFDHITFNATAGTTSPPPTATSPKSSKTSLSPSPPYRPQSFKFSLEWLDKPSWPAVDRPLKPPVLPWRQDAIFELQPAPATPSSASSSPHSARYRSEIRPRKPGPEYTASTRYSGRALAEWELVVAECDGFCERRMAGGSGVSRVGLVETPQLGVENFRMAGT